jgi:two-component system, NarL family, nitrate/nitrite response regulator NarL
VTSVVVADDHAFFRSGLEAALSSAGFKILASVPDGQSALKAVAQHNPDILIMDVRMPICNGVEAIEALRASGDDRPVIVLANELSDEELYKVMRANASGVVLKHGPEAHIFSAIEAAMGGARFIQGDLLERAMASTQNARGSSAMDTLTERERRVVEEISRGLRNSEIAQRLDVTEGTIKVYLHKIYTKLGVKSRTELALMARDGRVN